MDPGDPENVERRRDVAGERRHRVVAGHRVAPAMPAHVEAQDPEPGLQQRRHLLGPHAAVGSQRMGDADNRSVLRADEIVVETASGERQQHGDPPDPTEGDRAYYGTTTGSPVMIG